MSLGESLGDDRERERAFHNLRIASCRSIQTIIDSVLHDMGVLDAKSAALLQFISVVLAALTFALGLLNEAAPHAHFIRGGIFLFMGVFGLAAWIDLRCLRSLGPSSAVHHQSNADFENEMLSEISRRRKSYRLALRITGITFTMLALLIIVRLALTSARAFI